MAVLNIHSRRLAADADQVGALVDTLTGPHDRLWPGDRWPVARLDGPLGVGARGGHGPVRYRVEEYEPARRIRFRFNGSPNIDGYHEFTVTPDGDAAVLRHTLAGRPRGITRLTWPFFYRRMHDALLEDLLDRAERELTGTVATPARWSAYVRLLRAVRARIAPATAPPRSPVGS
ncbi:SRPBCC family protein [Nocardia bovistercoris]|uniref:SRPBCC family protein n=1 Tax=Nocardia bovistercoris TaxID=2785916 RepID=A0A931IDU8_9NOCA|nr:SRPBCC family protein [Nocardia bovistercoris]MBH0778708.1 SRPBCC family protein [Nocardia bovistercoris]